MNRLSVPTPATTPASSAAAGASGPFKTSRWFGAALVIAVFMVLGVTVSSLAIERAAASFSKEMGTLREDVRAMRDGIDIMVPPNNDKLFSILSKGIGVTEDVVRTATATSVAPSAAFATDLVTTPFNQQTDAFTQEIVIHNLDASTPAQNLCFKPIPWSTVGATCNDKCITVNATFTCAAPGAAVANTDGVYTAQGQSWQRRYDGTSCICVRASAAGTFYQSERVLR